jgi:acyl-CoA thioester hydrolase
VKTNITEVRVRFGDTDPFGVVYFVSYLRYFKSGLDEYLRSCGIKPEELFRNKARKIGFPIVESFAQYKAPARYDDLLEVHTSLKELREKAAIFEFKIYKKEKEGQSKQFLANGTITCVAIDNSWKPIPIPEDIARKLKGDITARELENRE